MTILARILKPGLQTTLQDAGRPRLRHLGVPLSGAADPLSLALANAALGNPPGAAALECTLTGPTIQFDAETAFALSGADMNATLNGEGLKPYQAVGASAGDILTLGAAKIGARAFVAFQGGLKGEEFLGSVSTYLHGALGGIEGRALQAGDGLHGAHHSLTAPSEIPAPARPLLAHDFVFRAGAGPDAALFEPGDLEQFFAAPMTADQRANRMGIRLNGYTLNNAPPPNMKSSAVFPGTVQCPPDGAPFLLLADAQTTGGYPRIAQVIAADLPLTGQVRPGDRVWFRQINPAEARDIAQKKQALLDAILPGFSFY